MKCDAYILNILPIKWEHFHDTYDDTNTKGQASQYGYNR